MHFLPKPQLFPKIKWKQTILYKDTDKLIPVVARYIPRSDGEYVFLSTNEIPRGNTKLLLITLIHEWIHFASTILPPKREDYADCFAEKFL